MKVIIKKEVYLCLINVIISNFKVDMNNIFGIFFF